MEELLRAPHFASTGCGGGEGGGWEGSRRCGGGVRWAGSEPREARGSPPAPVRAAAAGGEGGCCRDGGAEGPAMTSRTRPRARGEGRPRPLPSPSPQPPRPQATRESKNGFSYRRTETLPNRGHSPRLPLAATSFFFLSRCPPPSSTAAAPAEIQDCQRQRWRPATGSALRPGG